MSIGNPLVGTYYVGEVTSSVNIIQVFIQTCFTLYIHWIIDMTVYQIINNVSFFLKKSYNRIHVQVMGLAGVKT